MEGRLFAGMYKGVVFADLTVKKVQADPADGLLKLFVTYADREYVTVLLHETYYSQLDERACGMRIACIEEKRLDQLGSGEYQGMLQHMLADCGEDIGFMESLEARGHRVFVHHTADGMKYLVVARRLEILESWV